MLPFLFIAESLWKTDLDFMVVHRDRLVILNFFTSPPNSSNASFIPTPQPFASTPESDDFAGAFPDNQQLRDILGPHFANDSGIKLIFEKGYYKGPFENHSCRVNSVKSLIPFILFQIIQFL